MIYFRRVDQNRLYENIVKQSIILDRIQVSIHTESCQIKQTCLTLDFRAEQTVCIRYWVTGISSDSKYRIVTFEYKSLLVTSFWKQCASFGRAPYWLKSINGKCDLYSFGLVSLLVTRYSWDSVCPHD